MEVKIGVQHSARDIVLESNQTHEEITAAVTAALTSGALLTLTDDKGRTVLIPGDKVSYLEIDATERSQVGFRAL